MPSKETLEAFVQNLPKMSPVVQGLALRTWERNTRLTLSEAIKRAPVASGELIRSGGTRKATITPNGIESYIEFLQPYASKLNDNDGDFRLKEVGEISYYTPQVIKKKQKGEKGFLTNAIEQYDDKFADDVLKAISVAWSKV